MKSLSIENLSKTYASGVRALRNIDLEVKAGEFYALLGANGAGKTTVIGILAGLVNKTSGRAHVCGYDIDLYPTEAKKMMGMVPQEINFNMFEKVQDVVINQAGFFGIPREVAAKDAEVLLRRLKLWDKRLTPSRNLSGGMKRRLMIARALISKPKILLLDEPTAGVDVELRHSMWDYLRELNRQGMTILLTTHYLEEVEKLCSRAAIIKDGVIIMDGEVAELVKTLEGETYVARLSRHVSAEYLTVYQPKALDEKTYEVYIDKKHSLDQFFLKLKSLDIKLEDLRPKTNRLEKLFMRILRK